MTFTRICGAVALAAAVLFALGAKPFGLAGSDLLAIGIGAAGLGLVV